MKVDRAATVTVSVEMSSETFRVFAAEAWKTGRSFESLYTAALDRYAALLEAERDAEPTDP